MVQRKRHFAKALTYRFFGTFGTGVVAYVVTGDASIGAAVGVLDSAAKIGLYYLHERAWYRVRWGILSGGDGETATLANPRIASAVEAKPPVEIDAGSRTKRDLSGGTLPSADPTALPVIAR